jgi:hypothetical protein
MSKWKLFSKSKTKGEDKPEPQEEIKNEQTPEPQIENTEEQNIEEEEKILAEYKETLYTGSTSDIKGRKQALTDQRIWRDMKSIERNIDTMEVKKVVKPIHGLENKVDNIISGKKQRTIPPPKKPSNVIYVVSKPQPGQVKGDWAVRGHGKIYSHHRLKDSAIKQARKIAKEKNATVLIQNTDGTFSGSFKPKQKK